MSDRELIDLVDANNKIVGTTTKSLAHSTNQPHRVAAIFIFDNHGQILVNRRMDNNLLDHSVGGHIRAGEAPRHAAGREAREEVGLADTTDLTDEGHFFIDEAFHGQPTSHWFYLYSIVVEHSFRPVIQPEEVAEGFWVDFKTLVEKMRTNPENYSAGFIGTVNFYLQKHQSQVMSISTQ